MKSLVISLTLAFTPLALAIGAASYDATGPQACHTSEELAISGRVGLYETCKGMRLGLSDHERFIRYVD